MNLVDLVKRFFGAISGSKKATGLVIGLIFLFIVPVLKRVGVEVTDEEKQWVMILFTAWLASQGLADIGKEKAKVEAGSAGEFVEPDDPEDPPAGVTSGTVG